MPAVFSTFSISADAMAESWRLAFAAFFAADLPAVRTIVLQEIKTDAREWVLWDDGRDTRRKGEHVHDQPRSAYVAEESSTLTGRVHANGRHM